MVYEFLPNRKAKKNFARWPYH